MKILNDLTFKSPSMVEKNNVTKIDFKELLMESIDKISTYEKDADNLGLLLATGEIDNIHDVVIASQKAEMALQFGIEIKNKIMDAYQEIMRIQI